MDGDVIVHQDLERGQIAATISTPTMSIIAIIICKMSKFRVSRATNSPAIAAATNIRMRMIQGI